MTAKNFDPTKEVVFETHRHTPLQVVRWKEQRVALTTSGSSQELVIPAGAQLIEITAQQDCFVNFANATGVIASSTIASDGSRFFAAGVQVIPVPFDPGTTTPMSHVAVIQDTVAGIFQIEEVE